MQHRLQQKMDVAFSYPCVFSKDVFDPAHPAIIDVLDGGRSVNRQQRVLVVVDQAVAELHPELGERIARYFARHAAGITLVSDPVVVPGGEAVKNDEIHVRRIVELVNRYRIDRHSFIFAIGGGAVLDMVGYAAAICHRGIRLVRFPTTVLAQNDSGVGVKNGINAFGKKNFLGTFVAPFAVINDFQFLSTLEDRDWRSGMAEAVKVALLRDAAFFASLEQNVAPLAARDMAAMQSLIVRCAELHLEHIATSGDPFEAGTSRPLDFGHWAAHKLEQLSDFRIRHGEAVAIGLALDSVYSMLDGRLDEASLERILRLFVALGFDLYAPELMLRDAEGQLELLAGLQEFREHLGGELTVMLLEAIGRGVETHHMDDARIVQSLDILRGWATARGRKTEV
ncbi:MAG: 3-dehydroquinate synthase [Kiritimatiellia bacterium]